MGEQTAISWTDATWNPVTGCAKVSPGCAHCYAETIADRFWATQYPKVAVIPGSDSGRPRTFADVQCHVERVSQPLHWKRARRIFVNSMSDLFHEAVPDAFIGLLFGVMSEAYWHTFQVLTKRADRLLEWSRGVAHYPKGDRTQRPAVGWPSNVWIGVSVENQHFADERIRVLHQVQAAIRFVSCEPLLGPVDLSNQVHPLSDLDWVIAGGESGAHCRPSSPDWFRSLRDQCIAAGVPFHFKQWGGRTPKANGRELDGREWLEFPKARTA